VHSAHDWRTLLEPIVTRYREQSIRRFFRADAAFARPEVYEYLEQERFAYAIRLPANKVLQRAIAHLLTRPVGRPSRKPKVLYHSFEYQAGSWDRSRRVVAKVEWHAGELFPRVGFIVTNLPWRVDRVVRFYNKRGTAEQWGGQVRGEVDAAELPRLLGQRNPAAALRAGLQPGELRTAVGVAWERPALVADDTPREVDQDRREGGAPCEIRDVSDGGGRGPAAALRDNPASYWEVAPRTAVAARGVGCIQADG